VYLSLTQRGNTVLTASRASGDVRVDLTDPASIADLYAKVGKLDAVASAAGVTPFKPIQELTADDYTASFQGKVLAQIELVRQGIHHIAADGSFTLITAVLARSPILTGAAASMAGGALESLVRAAAIEIAPQRINAISRRCSPRRSRSTATTSRASPRSGSPRSARPTSGRSRASKPARSTNSTESRATQAHVRPRIDTV
jgi:NADP-dependent 3-hydroxy acid dehydrogenase YdfG